MTLPGITKEQMVEVDRLMTEDYHIPVELMMEHAGLNLAHLAVKLFANSRFQVIVGSGNNGGGGLVAARRLISWNLETEVYIPKGVENLRKIPKKQLFRAKEAGVQIFEELPSGSLIKNQDNVILDCYLGYGFKPRTDKISDLVFLFLQNENVISLDAPSGLDVTSGERGSKFSPIATLTLAFVKKGFLNTSKEVSGDLYIADIGVPSNIYQYKLGIKWIPPFDVSSLKQLNNAFRKDSLQRVFIKRASELELSG